MIYKYPVLEKNEEFFAPANIIGFDHDGHNQLCVWAINSDLKVKFKVVGTGWDYDDNWTPTKLMAISNGGFVWHLLKHN